jgi:hypothetical protein
MASTGARKYQISSTWDETFYDYKCDRKIEKQAYQLAAKG